MKIALAQLNFTIGAFEENAAAITDAINRAKAGKADLAVFSELCVCGYPPLDLLEHKSFIINCQTAVDRIAEHAQGIAVILGAPTLNPRPKGKNLCNSALFIEDGVVKQLFYKTLLPTYDIFDEYRHFQPADEVKVLEFGGKKIAVTICEDLWYKQPLLTDFGKHKMYTTNPMKELERQGADLVINIAASPFAYNHDSIKTGILTDTARSNSIPVIYVNQVGAHTELIFDGGSRVVDGSGKTRVKFPLFREHLQIVDMDEIIAPGDGVDPELTDEVRLSRIHDALVLGIRDYFSKMNFRNAVLGLSGGIDSAVTLVLAAEALGPENVRVLLLPSQFSSGHSVQDARALAEKLGVHYDIIPIQNIFDQYQQELKPVFDNLPFNIAEENIQARIRGTLLMAISNKFGNLLLNTSNKSEVAVGYGTLYGDMNGGISVLGDVYKTDVYRLANYINRKEEIIPLNTIQKPPSAELRPDQKDSDSLPDYDLLDSILYSYIELKKTKEEIVNLVAKPELVEKVIRLVNMNEYKRFQTPPILRVSSKAFGFGRRMPLVARYS